MGGRSRRPPISLDTMVARTEGSTCSTQVWDLSIVQGPFSVAPCQTLDLRFVTFASLCAASHNSALPVDSLVTVRSLACVQVRADMHSTAFPLRSKALTSVAAAQLRQWSRSVRCSKAPPSQRPPPPLLVRETLCRCVPLLTFWGHAAAN